MAFKPTRGITSYALGGTAILLTVASPALTAAVSVSLLKQTSRVKALGYVAFVLQVLSLVSLSYFSFYYVRKIQDNSLRLEKRKLLALIGIGIVISIVAAAVTTASIVWISVLSHGRPSLVVRQASHALYLTWCIEWAFSLLAQMLFYGYLLWLTSNSQDNRSSHRLSRDFGSFGIVPEMQEDRRPQTAETVRSVLSQEQGLSSPPRTPTTSDAISSFRSSLSRTKLITRQRSFPRNSNNSSLDLPSQVRGSQDEAFDSWDTSSVGPQLREAILHSSPNSVRAAPLEPIPGSRSESPADALDGPFLPQSPHPNTTSVPSSPIHFPPSSPMNFPPSSPINFSSSSPVSYSLSNPINFSRPTSRHRAASAEDHIHPLFRTSSPTPPPTATPGTTVTAAPNAGQMISGRTLNRMRSGSLPSASSPLANGDTELPPSPPPAIPSFVLSAGKRTSLVGYGKRRGTLKETEEEEEEEEEEEGNAPFF